MQLSPIGHTLPQVPQLLESVATDVQAVPQKLGMVFGQHMPALQI
jgi:hypothetical protein